jgi:predicted enzyme related to lactoylglutathione lyase
VSGPHGSFCFAELHTADVEGAKRFYGDLLGWKAVDSPVDGYTLFQLDGKDVAGLRRVEQSTSRWIPFLSVASADSTSAKALQLGAAVMRPAADTRDLARTAVLRDPAGGMLGLWEARGHAGAALLDEPGSLWWSELLTRDVAVAKTFYSNLLGWRAIDTLKYGIRYSVFKLGDESLAGLLPIGADWGAVSPYWQILFAVDNCDARVDRAKKAGGSLVFGPNDVPNAGRAAIVSDPRDAVLVLMQPLPGGGS